MRLRILLWSCNKARIHRQKEQCAALGHDLRAEPGNLRHWYPRTKPEPMQVRIIPRWTTISTTYPSVVFIAFRVVVFDKLISANAHFQSRNTWEPLWSVLANRDSTSS